MKHIISVFIILIILSSSSVVAQQTRLNDYNTISWNAVFLNFSIDEKLSVHGEFQLRRSDFLVNPQQNLYRFGINYKLHEQVVFRLGGAFADTYPNGKVPIQASARLFPEYRSFQMLQLSNPLGKINLTHRFMLEQRWVGRFTKQGVSKADDYVFLNRMRYMARIDIPLNFKENQKSKPYLAAYDEIFIGFGKNVQQNVFDQNRFGILAGLKFNPKFRIEGGYVDQTLQFGRLIDAKPVFQYNRGLIINSYISL
jgi:hypothetical protein